MSWVSLTKFKTVCEAIKNYVVEQCDDVYNKVTTTLPDKYVSKSGDTMTGVLYMKYDSISNMIEASNKNGISQLNGGLLSVHSLDGKHSITIHGAQESPFIRLYQSGENDTYYYNNYIRAKSFEISCPLSVKAPTAMSHATTKEYVDTAVKLKVNTSDEITDDELTTLTNLFS